MMARPAATAALTVAAAAVTAAWLTPAGRRFLSVPERHSRKLLRVPPHHPERITYRVPHPERWQALSDQLWPDGWAHVIEESMRERGWGGS